MSKTKRILFLVLVVLGLQAIPMVTASMTGACGGGSNMPNPC